MEQDFGLFEGATYGEWFGDQDICKASVETDEAMLQRARSFVHSHIMPLADVAKGRRSTVAVVSHGMMLKVVWTALLEALKPVHVDCSHDLLIETRSLDYARLGTWSNTGFLEVDFTPASVTSVASIPTASMSGQLDGEGEKDQSGPGADAETQPRPAPSAPLAVAARISAINGTDHLTGLKKSNVGNSSYDPKQGNLHSYFKPK